MGLKVYGIGAAQNEDSAGETILLDGLNDGKLRGVRDEHDEDNMFHRVGAITKSKKIYSAKDCEDEKQLRCWNHAQVPFLYAEAELANDTEHPNAIAAAELIKFTQRDDIPLDIGFSVDGGILERKTSDGMVTEDRQAGKTISKSMAYDLAITVKPCNPKCKMFLENDLTKSILAMNEPIGYKELLKKSRAATSFFENPDSEKMFLLDKLTDLKKSLDDYFSGFTNMNCYKCSTPVRFFKSNQDVPHMCKECGSIFSMSSIWKALNK